MAHDIVETHISVVHLYETEVFKILKPVRFGFLDFSTAERRRAACEQEVEHNRAWAPGVYLGVVPVGDPWPTFGGSGPATDCAIHMKRLAAEATLVAQACTLSDVDLTKVGAWIRSRHTEAPCVSGAANYANVVHRIRENAAELADLLPNSPLMDRVLRALEHSVMKARGLLEARAETGLQLHGDLRAEHVYLCDDGIRILDGLAFNPELSCGDPIEDVAFLAMELCCDLHRWDLEQALWTGWSKHTDVPRRLKSLYCGHRALIRAKIDLLAGRDPTRHLVHALFRLGKKKQRPLLIGVGGLPGVGKSTVAAGLKGAQVLRTDVIRKESDTHVHYTNADRAAVYSQLFKRARAELLRGSTVVLDASFTRRAWRSGLFELGDQLGVPVLLLWCEASAAVVEQRLRDREQGPSDADVAVYQKLRACWDRIEPSEEHRVRRICTEHDAIEQAQEAVGTYGRSRASANRAARPSGRSAG